MRFLKNNVICDFGTKEEPVLIEREELYSEDMQSSTIYWYGIRCNYAFQDKKWYEQDLVTGEIIECDIPYWELEMKKRLMVLVSPMLSDTNDLENIFDL